MYQLTLGQAHDLTLICAIDDAAASIYTSVGIHFELADDHPFVVAEQAGWAAALRANQVWLARRVETDAVVGFAALESLDGEPYLAQLAVLPEHMRRGVGSLLLQHTIVEMAPAPLWLTTYAHVAWNRPYYERFGFRVIPEAECGPAMRALLQAQRAALPAPEQRVAMRRV